MKIKPNTIHCANNLDIMKQIPDNTIDLTVTSPPYGQIRDYEGYSYEPKKVFDELHRITKTGHIVVWIENDAYVDNQRTLDVFEHAQYAKSIDFLVHDIIIYERWSVPNAKVRYHQGYEFMLILSKHTPPVTTHLIKDRKNITGAKDKNKSSRRRQSDGTLKRVNGYAQEEYGYRSNVWKYEVGYLKTTKDQFAFAHPAQFPEKLAADHITSWSNPHDLILDPFCGAGTTLKMAKLLDRDYIGIDISQKYYNISKQRVQQERLL